MIRGEIWWANFGIPYGSEPGFDRPVVIIQNDQINKSKINTTIVIPLTTNLLLEEATGNVYLDKEETGLPKNSVAVVSQISVLDKKRLVRFQSTIQYHSLLQIEDGIKVILQLP